jgi:hypothetical protein
MVCLAALSWHVVMLPLDWSVDWMRTPEHRLRLAQLGAGALAVLGGVPALTLLRRPGRSRAGAS